METSFYVKYFDSLCITYIQHHPAMQITLYANSLQGFVLLLVLLGS